MSFQGLISGHEKTQLAMVAIGAIVILDGLALANGQDGVFFATSLAAIGTIFGGMLGFTVGVKKT